MKHYRFVSSLSAVGSLGLAAVLSGGCRPAAVAASKPAAEFPSQAQLQAIAPAPVAAGVFGKAEVAADGFAFDGEPAAAAQSYDDASPWGELVKQAAQQAPGAKASPSLLCAARAIASFQLKHGALPAEGVKRFMSARCGVAAQGAGFVTMRVKLAAGASDEQIFKEASGPVREGLVKQLRAGAATEAAIGIARDAEYVSLVVGMAKPKVVIAPIELTDDGKTATVRGRLLDPAEWVVGLANQGKHKVASCLTDPGVALPSFVLRCPFDPGDRLAWLSISSHREGRFLLSSVADVLLHRGDAGSLTYQPADDGAPEPVRSGAELSAALLRRLNKARAAAGLGALTAAPAQSATNARLAGAMTQAMLTGDEKQADLIATGLSAGWDIAGTIRHGDFFVSMIPSSSDVGAWLANALERPLGRSIVLLDPGAQQLAVGPILAEGGKGIGAVTTTYSLFSSDDHAADVERVHQAIARARAARGLPAQVKLAAPDGVGRQLAMVSSNKRSVEDATHTAMSAVVNETGRSVRAVAFETIDIDHLPVSETLLAKGRPRVVVGVTHHKVEGAAWGQYVVVAIVVEGDAGQTAAAEGQRGAL